VSVKVGDSTGEAWVSIFNEQAEALIGMSADELAQIKEEVSSALTVWLACRFL
jgi:replication factor A1